MIKVAQFAEYGSRILTDGETSTAGELYCALVVIEEAVCSDITSTNITTAATLEGETLAVGTVIYGRITAVTVTTGIVQLINFPSYGL